MSGLPLRPLEAVLLRSEIVKSKLVPLTRELAGAIQPPHRARRGKTEGQGEARPKDKAERRGKAKQQGVANGEEEWRGEEWFISWGELRFLTIKICIAIKN